MLIVESKKALLFRLREPSRITTVIPTAKVIYSKTGAEIVAVPHRPDETRVCRNLGFTVPPPMPIYYTWPTGFTPFKAQIETSSFLTMHDRAFCLNSMGTGKTVTSLAAYDYLRSVKQVKKALVVCPLSTMEDTWANEIFRKFPHLDSAVLYGSREKRLKLLQQDVDVYIINADGIKTISNALAKRPDIDLIIVDELAMFRNASTERWKILNTICNKQTRRKVWGLTGAPIPHEPTDAWAQCKLVVPDNKAVPSYFTKFKQLVMRQCGPYKWVPKENAVDTVYSLMQPAIRFALDDCTDLPPETYITREVKMTDEQDEAYKAMLKKLKTEYAGGEIMASNEAVKASKLLQISLGVAYGAGGERVVIPSHTRLAVLEEIIEESEGKVLVFVPLTGALEAVAAHLQQKGWTVSIVHGETTKSQRDEIFRNFQENKDPHVLVANPKTMSHGLTLTAATTIAWYGPTNSNDTYVQACARVRRPGQTRTTVIVHIVSNELERRVFARLKDKQTMQNVLLDMLKEGGEE
jgi:SNF2 family DNA or RNA helicase